MSSVQPPLLYSVKLECPIDLVHLSTDSSEGAIPNVSLPTSVAHIPINNPKSVFTPIGSCGQSHFSCLLFHPNTWECTSVMQCLRRLASILGSRNELASIDYDKIIYYKVQYLPPLYDGNFIFELLPTCPLLLLRTLWMVWISGLMVVYE
jgi:hypothetical protein